MSIWRSYDMRKQLNRILGIPIFQFSSVDDYIQLAATSRTSIATFLGAMLLVNWLPKRLLKCLPLTTMTAFQQRCVIDFLSTFTLHACVIATAAVYKLYGAMPFILVSAIVGIIHICTCEYAFACDGSMTQSSTSLADNQPFPPLIFWALTKPFLSPEFRECAIDAVTQALACIMGMLAGQLFGLSFLATFRSRLIYIDIYTLHCLPWYFPWRTMLLEMIGVLLICTFYTFGGEGPIFFDLCELVVKVVLGTVAATSGFHHPGIFLNPSLATTNLTGCQLQRYPLHYISYLLVPLVVAAVYPILIAALQGGSGETSADGEEGNFVADENDGESSVAGGAGGNVSNSGRTPDCCAGQVSRQFSRMRQSAEGRGSKGEELKENPRRSSGEKNNSSSVSRCKYDQSEENRQSGSSNRRSSGDTHNRSSNAGGCRRASGIRQSCSDKCPSPCETEPQCQTASSDCGIDACMTKSNCNGRRRLNYVFDIPPHIAERGVRLRHRVILERPPDN